MRKLYMIACILSITVQAMAEKVLIMTYSYSRPDFIELHDTTFKTFMQDEYEYVVFNDASDESMCNAIESTCARLGVKCVRIPQKMHEVPGRTSPGHRHMDCIQYSLDLIGYQHEGIVMLIDADMFLIKPFSVKNYVGEYHVIGGEQWREQDNLRVTYIAPTMVLINMKTAPNKTTIRFEGGYIHGLACDVGAHMYYYLQQTPGLSYRLFIAESTDRLPHDAQLLRDLGYDDLAISFILTTPRHYGFEFHGDGYFLHYYAGGSNWPGYGQDYLHKKDRVLYNFVAASKKVYGLG